MDNLLLGLKVAAIGICGVFIVLVILMGAIKGFELLIKVATEKLAERKPEAKAVSAPVAPVAIATADSGEDEELVAVITAAIMAVLQSENAGNMPSFTIKKIKQIKRN